MGVSSLEKRAGFWGREEGYQNVVKDWEKEGPQEQAGVLHMTKATLRDARQELNTRSAEQRP